MKRKYLLLFIAILAIIVPASIMTFSIYNIYFVLPSHAFGFSVEFPFLFFTFGGLCVTLLCMILLPFIIRRFHQFRLHNQVVHWYQYPLLTFCLAGLFPGLFVLWVWGNRYIVSVISNMELLIFLSTILDFILTTFFLFFLVLTAINLQRKSKWCDY